MQTGREKKRNRPKITFRTAPQRRPPCLVVGSITVSPSLTKLTQLVSSDRPLGRLDTAAFLIAKEKRTCPGYYFNHSKFKLKNFTQILIMNHLLLVAIIENFIVRNLKLPSIQNYNVRFPTILYQLHHMGGRPPPGGGPMGERPPPLCQRGRLRSAGSLPLPNELNL